MRKKLAIALALLAALLAIPGAAAATPGNAGASGTITVDSVWVYDIHQFVGSGTHVMDADCPAGEKVISGYGIWADMSSSSLVSGSALDADTWRVSFFWANSFTYTANLSIHAQCV